MSYTSAHLSVYAPGAHSNNSSSSPAMSFRGNWTSNDDLGNLGPQYSFCYDANFSKVGSQRYDAAFSELVSYQFAATQSKKAGNARTSSLVEDTRISGLLFEDDDATSLANAFKANLLNIQSTDATARVMEVIADRAPASLAMPLETMTPIASSSSAAGWLNGLVWDCESVGTPESAPTHATQLTKQELIEFSVEDRKEFHKEDQPKFEACFNSEPTTMARAISGPGLGIMFNPTKSSEVYEAVVLASMASATSLLVPDKPRLFAVESDEDIHISPFMLSRPSMVASISFVVSSPLHQNAPKAPRLYHSRVAVDSPAMSYSSAQIDAAQLVKTSKCSRISDVASISFAFPSPLLKNAPKAPRLYHASVAVDSPTMNYSSAQVDAAQLVKTPKCTGHIYERQRRHVHGQQATSPMQYTDNTFDGPLETPSKPSSHCTFLSLERKQLADFQSALASRPQVFETPAKVRVPDSLLLEDSSEWAVLASNTLQQQTSLEPNFSHCLHTSEPLYQSDCNVSPVSPRLAGSLISNSFVTPRHDTSPSISPRISPPGVKTRYASFVSPTPLLASSIKPIQYATPKDDTSPKFELSTSSSLSISFPRVETFLKKMEQTDCFSLLPNSGSQTKNVQNPSLDTLSSLCPPRDISPHQQPSVEPGLDTSETLSHPISNESPASARLPPLAGPFKSGSVVTPQNDVETRNVSSFGPHTSPLAISIKPIQHTTLRYELSPKVELPTSTSLSICFPRVETNLETIAQTDCTPLSDGCSESQTKSVQNPSMDPLSPLGSPRDISPALGTTDSFRVSQSFEGLGLGLPSTLTSGSLADECANEDSPVPDPVSPQPSANRSSERANPRFPSHLASEPISGHNQSGSSDMTLFDSIDSDQVERTTSLEDAAVTALLDALSPMVQQREYDLPFSISFMTLHRFPKRSLYDIPEADTPPATPPTALPTSQTSHGSSSASSSSASSASGFAPSASPSSASSSASSSSASSAPASATSAAFSSVSSTSFSNTSENQLSPHTPHVPSPPASPHSSPPENIVKSVRRFAAPACLSSFTLKRQQQEPSLVVVNAAACPGNKPSAHTPHASSSFASPSSAETTHVSSSSPPSENIIKSVRRLAAYACLSSLTLEKQPSPAVANAPAQPSGNTPPFASCSSSPPSENVIKPVRRLAAYACLSSLTLKKQQPSPAVANAPAQPSENTPPVASCPPSPPSSENILKPVRRLAAYACLSSLTLKKKQQPSPVVINAAACPGSEPSDPPPTNESQSQGSGAGEKKWPFKFRWSIFSAVPEEAIRERGSSNLPQTSPCIIHEDLPANLGFNDVGGRGKGALKFLF